MAVIPRNSPAIDHNRPDLFPNSDLEMWERLMNFEWGGRANIADHFRGRAGGAILGMWTWAGAPFVTPGRKTIRRSYLSLGFLPALPGRAFLFKADPGTGRRLVAVALSARTLDFACGVRIDDGTDNNYAEIVLRVSQALPNQWDVETRSRIGGGAVAVVNADTLTSPLTYVLEMDIDGTQWTAWGIETSLSSEPAGGSMLKNALVGGAWNWTPTRTGIILDAPAAALANDAGLVDWYYD